MITILQKNWWLIVASDFQDPCIPVVSAHRKRNVNREFTPLCKQSSLIREIIGLCIVSTLQESRQLPLHSAQLRAWRQISHWQSSQARRKGELCQPVIWHLLISQYPRCGVYIMFTDLDSFIFYSFFSVVTNLYLGSPGHVSWRHTLLYTYSGFFANHITALLLSVARLNSDYFNTLRSHVTGFSTIRHITIHPPPIPYTK